MVDEPFVIQTFTASDGCQWKYRYYPPAGPVRGHVVGLHGIQSHGGWYVGSCLRLSDAGFAVWFLDRRGAGLNRDYPGPSPSSRRMIDDVAEFIRRLSDNSNRPYANGVHAHSSPLERNGSPVAPARPPILLMGISWGGKLATAVQRKHPALSDALALVCPGLFSIVDQQATWRKFLRMLTARFLQPERKFVIPLSDPWLFTDTPHWQQFIAEDPLMMREGTARMAFENGRITTNLCCFPPGAHRPFFYAHLIAQVRQRRRIRPTPIEVPVLLMLAERDRIIDNRLTRQFFEKVARNTLSIIEYPGAHHTLEFEPDPEPIFHDLLDWMEHHALPASCAVV